MTQFKPSIKLIAIPPNAQKGFTHSVLVKMKPQLAPHEKVLLEINSDYKVYQLKNGTTDVVISKPKNHPLLKDVVVDIHVRAVVYDTQLDKLTMGSLATFAYLPNGTLVDTNELRSCNSVLIGDWSKFRAKFLDERIEIEKIKLTSDLQLGSANTDKVEFQNGMVFGNTYTFEVQKYRNGKPINIEEIKWYIRFHNLTRNKWEEIHLKATGDKITLLMNNLEFCGRFIYIRAYLHDKKVFAEQKIWFHNRFRWFSSARINEEIIERTNLGQFWRINQASTSLCGMGCLFYLFAKEQSDKYVKFSKELFRTGMSKHNGYTVNPSKEILEKIINKEGYPLGTGNMPLIDYVTLAGTRNTENPKYKGGDEQYEAVNWPQIMVNLCKNFLGYKIVYDNTIPINNKVKSANLPDSDILRRIEDINNQIKKGFKLILMIDADLIDDSWDFDNLDYHWVVLEEMIQLKNYLNSNGNSYYLLDFKVFTPWGVDMREPKEIYLKEPITFTHFIKNYYGYIKVK